MRSEGVAVVAENFSAVVGPFDLVALLQRFRGKREFVVKLLTLIGQDLVNYRDAIRKAHTEANMPGLRTAAHTIKGAALNVSAGELSHWAAQLEQLALGEKRDSLDEIIAHLEQAIEKCIVAIPLAVDQIR